MITTNVNIIDTSQGITSVTQEIKSESSKFSEENIEVTQEINLELPTTYGKNIKTT